MCININMILLGIKHKIPDKGTNSANLIIMVVF